MCEFCHKHGEGRKWYLEASNYSDDLLSDVRRRKMIADFSKASPEQAQAGMDKLARLNDLPGFVRRAIIWNTKRRMKQVHYGQVVPIEDIERIFGFVNSITRLACGCRKVTVGGEQRFCYGISLSPGGGEFARIVSDANVDFMVGPTGEGLEALSRDEAVAAFRDHEKQGLCHTVWTFVAPFIGGICNCDRHDCLAMRSTVTYGMPMMFRAEYVSRVDNDLCNGCRSCMRVCQFGAISYSAAREKAIIDPRMCYGCGICRAVCARGAVTLDDRAAVPAAARIW
jgi:ferredoxin